MMPTSMIQQVVLNNNNNNNKDNKTMQQTKVTKVRRTRQPRNPQLSVARRNERERNRVKMVNNGFALLRERLPVEDLQACEQQSGNETPDGTSSGKSGQKAKKFSKVETLRAAIQRIKMLEELIRSTEPGFESINITSTVSSNMMFDEEPLSICGEASSCMSSSSPHSSSTATTSTQQQQINQLDNTNNPNLNLYNGQQQAEHFIKLESQTQQYNHNHNHCQQLNVPSPQNSQHSFSSSLNPARPQYHQVHPQQQQQQQQQQPTRQLDMQQPMSQTELVQEEPSHTHLWIQQHQSSFIEQQQQIQYQQQMNQTNWYAQQQQQQVEQKANWFVPQNNNNNHNNNIESVATTSNEQTTIQQVNSQPSPTVWFTNSPGSAISSNSAPQVVQSQASISTFNHHQISLYSQ